VPSGREGRPSTAQACSWHAEPGAESPTKGWRHRTSRRRRSRDRRLPFLLRRAIPGLRRPCSSLACAAHGKCASALAPALGRLASGLPRLATKPFRGQAPTAVPLAANRTSLHRPLRGTPRCVIRRRQGTRPAMRHAPHAEGVADWGGAAQRSLKGGTDGFPAFLATDGLANHPGRSKSEKGTSEHVLLMQGSPEGESKPASPPEASRLPWMALDTGGGSVLFLVNLPKRTPRFLALLPFGRRI
jgi:hypothetical protein